MNQILSTKKLLLIAPKLDFVPLNFAYIISSLKDCNIPYDFIDMQFYDGDFSELDFSSYFAVGTGGLIFSFYKIRDVISSVKKCNADIPIIVGGRVTSAPLRILERLDVDFFVLKDAFPALINLSEQLINKDNNFAEILGIAYKDSGNFVYNKCDNRIPLDNFRPCWDDIELQYYMDNSMTGFAGMEKTYPLISGLGCVGRCTFCAPTFRGHRVRPPLELIEELKSAVEKYVVRSFFVLSEIFYTREEDIKEFCSLYIKSGINLSYSISIRADFNPELLAPLVESGCRTVFVGVEAYDNQALKAMGKDITTDNIDVLFAKIKELKLNSNAGFLIGNLGDTPESIDKTADYFVENHIQNNGIHPARLLVYPGTKVYEIAIAENKITDEMEYFSGLCNNSAKTRVTIEAGMGELYPNVTQMTDEQYVESLASANIKLYYQNIKHYMSYDFDVETQKAKCHNCGAEILINSFPVYLYACSNCMSFTLFDIHNNTLAKKEYSEKIISAIKQNKRICLAGSYHFLMAILYICQENSIDFSGIRVLCPPVLNNFFSTQYAGVDIQEFERLYELDAVIFAGLQSPEEFTEHLLSVGMDRECIINATPVDFKSYHKNNLSQGYTFFEDTFDQDLIWFGERIGRYLCAKYTSNMHWLLVGDCNYSKMVQEGVRRCGLNFVASVHEIENHEDFNVLVASPRVPVTRQIVGDIAENFGCKRENVVCVAEDLYLALWDSLFISE